MDEQYDFSDISYEHIRHESALPFKAFTISVGYRGAHWHREFELLLALKGSTLITRGNSAFHLEKGDLFLVNPYEMHTVLKESESNLLLVLQLDPEISSACPSELQNYQFQLSPQNRARPEIDEAIKSTMKTILRETVRKNPGHEFACMSAVHHLVTLFVRNLPYTESTEANLKKKRTGAERLHQIIEYINRHHEENITLEELSELTHLSPYYISHLIKENTGRSFRENLSIIRTHHAVNLMLTTRKKLVDIAFEAGFSDLKYFNKGFKNLYGETPSEVRRRGKSCKKRIHTGLGTSIS